MGKGSLFSEEHLNGAGQTLCQPLRHTKTGSEFERLILIERTAYSHRKNGSNL